MTPFHKWVLCGINGSCTDLNPLGFISGGTVGKSIVMGSLNGTVLKKDMEMVNATRQITNWNRTITNQTAFLPSPVCVYPPFLLVLSNNSFRNCTNETCWMSQCWNARRYARALVVRVPQWIPIPVETPSTLSLFRQKRDFGINGNWSKRFEKTLEELRAAVVTINSTRVDLSLTDGLLSWVSSAFSYFKEWVGVGMFGAALCCGLVFLLWLVCKLKAQQQRDKVVIAQALVALEQGSSPKI